MGAEHLLLSISGNGERAVEGEKEGQERTGGRTAKCRVCKNRDIRRSRSVYRATAAAGRSRTTGCLSER